MYRITKNLNSQSNLKKNKLETSFFLISNYITKKSIIFPNFKLYYKDIIINIAWHGHKTRHIYQWNRVSLHMHGQLACNTGVKDIQWGRDNLFSKWWWENWATTYKTMKLDHYLIPYTKIKLIWIKDLNIRPETIKLLEENTAVISLT